MSQVIILTDNLVFADYGATRYIGPYVLASQLEAEDISCTVVDYISFHHDIFALLEKLITSDTLVIGISSTFMLQAGSKNSSRRHRSESK